MIIYFSATGNNQYIAQQIAQQINDKSKSMVELTDKEEYVVSLQEDEMLGIVVPTYFMGLPIYVEEFFSKIKINIANDNYIFIISSYGSSPGYSTGYVRDYLAEQKIHVDAEYSIKMPDTWTPIFDVSDKEKINRQSDEVEKQLNELISSIKDKKCGKYTHRTIPKIFANMAQMMYDNQRKTTHLNVHDSCNQCGICIESCPITAIEYSENKVQWKTERCVMCLRCLHRCPQFAIQYDKKTQNHGQYTNPHVKSFD